MSKRPWMPFYGGDFTAKTMDLSDRETGWYIRLIVHCWEHGSIPISNCRKLMLIAHAKKAIPVSFLERFFCPDGTNFRVTKELRKSEEISNKRKAAAEQMHARKMAPTSTVVKKENSPSKKMESTNGKGTTEEATRPSPEADLYRRGKEVLGSNAGGLISKLMLLKKRNVSECRSVVELAAGKENPREYLGRIISGRAPGQDADRDRKIAAWMAKHGRSVVFDTDIPGIMEEMTDA
jgi:uncharacterized protein YdaU (DUF1376 family)